MFMKILFGNFVYRIIVHGAFCGATSAFSLLYLHWCYAHGISRQVLSRWWWFFYQFIPKKKKCYVLSLQLEGHMNSVGTHNGKKMTIALSDSQNKGDTMPYERSQIWFWFHNAIRNFTILLYYW